MTSPRVLALLTGRPTPADLTEWLRVVAAFVAIGREVRLAEIGSGRGVLSAEGLTAEAERYLEGLEALDVRLESLDGAPLRDALLGADTVLRIGDPTRNRTPQVLEASPAWLTATPAADIAAALASAGQVVRAGPEQRPGGPSHMK